MKTNPLIQRMLLICLLSFFGIAMASASCQAGFTWTQSSANNLAFTNTSTGTTGTTFYTWNFGDGNYAYGANNGNHQYNVPGTYTACLQISDSLSSTCSSSFCQAVTVTGTLICTLSDYMTTTQCTCPTCPNGAATVNPGGGTAPYTYAWTSPSASTQSITGLLPGTYTVTVYDANGCSIVDTISVTVMPPPCQASYTWNQTNPNVVSFTSTSTNVNPNTFYTWSYGDASPNTYGQYPSPHTYSIPGTYTVCLYISDSTFSNNCNSSYCDTVNVTGSIICNLNMTLGGTNASCASCTDGTASLTSVSGGTAPYVYSWSTGATTAGIYNLSPGTYTLCITDANSCHACDTVTVGVNPSGPCHAYFTLTPDTTNPGNYWANNMSTGSTFMTFTWSWGDSSPNDTLATPSHTYPGPGLYTICLTVHDSSCTSTYCDTLTAVRLPSWVASHHTTVNVRRVTSPAGISEHTVLNEWSVFPNPSSGITTIAYTLNQNSNVQIGIFNTIGQEVMAVENVNSKAAGNYTMNIDASVLKPGIYMVRIIANDKSETRRLSVVR
jgi:PKD repeat protein